MNEPVVAPATEADLGAGSFRIPKQVTDNANAAETLHAEIFGTPDVTVPPVEALPADTVVTPASEIAPVIQSVEPVAPVVPAVETPAAVPAVPAVAAVETPAVPIDWEARFNTLQGKYNAEVPRALNDLATFKQTVSDRFDLLTPVAAPVVETPAAAPPVTAELAKLLEDFDEGLVNGILSVVRAEQKDSITTAVAPVAQQVVSVEEQQANVRRGEFETTMNASIEGDWKNLFSGADDGFNRFLAQPDASGLHTYASLADGFSANFDADRMAIIVNTYLATLAPAAVETVVDPTLIVPAAAPTPATVPATAPVVAAVAPVAPAAAPVAPVVPAVDPALAAQQALQNALIAPTTTAPRLTPVPEGHIRIWTPQSKDQFISDDRNGMYDAAASQALWDDMVLAPGQGRFRNQ